VDIVSDNRNLFGTLSPAIRYGHARMSKGKSATRMYVANVDDLQILTNLGVNATSIAGLAGLNGQTARGFFRDTPDKRPKYRLTLLNVRLTDLAYDVPVGVLAILDRLRDITTAMFDEHRICVDVWWPTVDEFEQLKAAARLQDLRLVIKHFSASVRRSTIPAVEAHVRLQGATKLNLPAAFRALAEALARHEETPCPNAVRSALKEYLAATQRYYGDMLQLQQNCGLPHVGLANLSAKVTHLLHTDEAIVHQARAIIDPDYEPVEKNFTEAAKLYGNFSKILIAINREMIRTAVGHK
jgi:hypothetical protein